MVNDERCWPIIVNARHPDHLDQMRPLFLPIFPSNTGPALTGSLQHLDGERLRIQLRKLPVNKLPIGECLKSNNLMCALILKRTVHIFSGRDLFNSHLVRSETHNSREGNPHPKTTWPS